MNGREPAKPRGRLSPALWTGILLLAGILIGLAAASEYGWLPLRHAGPDQAPQAPIISPLTPAPSAEFSDAPPFVGVARVATQAVVNISATRSSRDERSRGMPLEPFFRRFFGDEFSRRFESPPERRQQSLGSGVIVDGSGLILTNNHVVAKSDQIQVLLPDKRELKAKLIGIDSKTDLAVLKVQADGLRPVPWGDSDTLEVGEFVLAVGNPFGLNQTVTMGIISAVGRASMGIAEYEDFIQTDAAINPGNSGGALVNARGELIGINTAIFSQSGGNMGIGFAVPSSMARAVLHQLVKNGKVVRGWLGVSIQELTPELAQQLDVEARGVLVSEVLDGSPAQRAGLERGDVIIEYDGRFVSTPSQLRNAVARTAIGTRTTMKVVREKRLKTVAITIVEQPTNV